MNENGSQTLMEKVKEILHKIAGKKRIVFSVAGIFVAVGVAVVIYGIGTEDEVGNRKGQMFDMSGNSATAEYVTASGTTSLGYTMDEFEPDYIETELYIEEVYLSSGDEVTAGTPVFKVAEESIAEAKEELEEKKEETSLAYRAGLISYEQSKINAKYTYDAAILEGQQAEAVYNSAVKAAEEKLQQAKDTVTETEEKIEEYGDAYTGYYYEYNVDEYKEAYERNSSHYYTFLEEYGFSESDLNGSGMGGQSAPSSGSANQEQSGEEKETEENKDESGSGEESEDESGSEEKSEGGDGSGSGNGNGTENESGSGNGNGTENESGTGDGSGSGNGNGTENESGTGETSGSGNGNGTGEASENENSNGTENNNETGTGNGGEAGDEGSVQSLSENAMLLSLFADWNTTLSSLTSDNSLGEGLSLISVASTNQSDENYTRRLKTIQQMKSNMESSKSSYDKAWKEYEAAADQATAQAEKFKVQIESLRADLTEAETTYQLEIVEAETAYKKSLAQSELAKSDYDAAIQKANDELEALEDAKTEAEENLAEFEALLGDGYFYTQNAGTVMMVGTRSESNLQGGSMVVAYRNAEDISVTVSVSQEDINKLEVGDSAQVIVEEYGTFEGKITYLNPVSNSDSRTNITYEVIVDLNGDNISSLTENLTAAIIFQTGDSSQ